MYFSSVFVRETGWSQLELHFHFVIYETLASFSLLHTKLYLLFLLSGWWRASASASASGEEEEALFKAKSYEWEGGSLPPSFLSLPHRCRSILSLWTQSNVIQRHSVAGSWRRDTSEIPARYQRDTSSCCTRSREQTGRCHNVARFWYQDTDYIYIYIYIYYI